MNKYLVDVKNARWGNYQKYFSNKEEAVEYIKSIISDINTYCYLYKLESINLEERY